MAIIDKKFIHFKNYDDFISQAGVGSVDNITTPTSGSEESRNAVYGQIKGSSIVFIKDTKQIWTHGQLYSCKVDISTLAEAMQAPAVIYKSNSKVNLSSGDCKSHIYTSDTGIGVIILNDSTMPSDMFYQSECSSVQLMNITEIEDTAFRGCRSLTSVTIGNGVTKIGSWAFNFCSNLTSVTIPDSVTEIGVRAFSGCTSLASITIPDSVTSIGNAAFSGCSSLASITIGNRVSTIGSDTFYGCSSLTYVTIPDSVTYIGSFAFGNCTSLTSVTIPDSVTEIGESAFSECGLTSVTISKHITYIDEGAFNTCYQLSTIYCRASTPPDTVEDAGCLPYNSNLKIYIPINSLELYQNHEYWQYRVDALIETVFEDEVLESGTNIKTINGNSILGSGDITISGSSSGSAYSEVSHGTADTTFELTPNTFHVWDKVTELDLSLGAETAGVANEYLFQFTSGSTATSLTLPDDIKWVNDGVPVIEADKIYQISILKGLGNVLNWECTAPVMGGGSD